MDGNQNIAPKAAEFGVLGCLMDNKASWPLILPKLLPSHFYFPDAALLYDVIRQLIDQRKACDGILVKDELSKRKLLDKIGGPAQLAEILRALPTSGHADHYVNIVLDGWKRRSLMKQADKIARDAAGGVATDTILADASTAIYEIGKKDHERSFTDVSQSIGDLGFEPGFYLSTGFRSLDGIMYGYGPGDAVVVAARPSCGKSALLLNSASNLAATSHKIGVFSLEMPAMQLMQRLLCAKARVNLEDILKGQLTPAHHKDLARAKEWLREHKILIDDNPLLTPASLRLKTIQWVEHYGVEAVFVDYLQLMKGGFQKEYDRITECSQAIKLLALELNIPVIVAAQLNREVEGREDATPRLSDLRGSGSIEQDADVVMMIHRPNFKEGQYDDGVAKIIVPKNRRGPRGVADMVFLGNYTLFVET